MVGVAGFEPATSCSQNTRANQTALHPADIYIIPATGLSFNENRWVLGMGVSEYGSVRVIGGPVRG